MKFFKYLTAAAALTFMLCTGITVYANEENEETTDLENNETILYNDSINDEEAVFVYDDNGKKYYLSEDSEKGLKEINGETYYLSSFVYDDNGKKYYLSEDSEKGLKEINGETYYLSSNGAVKTGWYTVDGIRMFFDLETGRQVDGWIDYMNERFYSDPISGKLTGEQIIDGKNYFFDEKGRLLTGWFEYEDCKYYGGDTGEIYIGDCEIDGILYHFSQKGRFKSGWQPTADGKRIYFDYDTANPVYGWIRYNGFTYYSDEETGKYTGEQIINGEKYRFTDDGCLMDGFQVFPEGIRLYYDDGTIAKGLCGYKEKIYFFDENGYMQTGMQTIGENKYYFNEDGSMHTGFAVINGSKYYFQDNGVMQIGWAKLGKNKYYFKSDGVMAVGFTKIGTDKYYFGTDGIMKTGWQTISSQKYYFAPSGKMALGLVKIGSESYYFGTDGIMKTGWQTIDGKRYFFDSSGVLKPYVPKVFVGVGHGGIDSGAVGYIVEKEYTLKTGRLVAQYLKEAGVDYMLSRDADIDTTMEGKLKQCNDYDPDLIVDIHFNAAGGSGFEVYHSMYGGMSLTLAQNINGYVSKFMSGRGCLKFIRDGKDRFTIIRETHAPAVLIEGGYVDVWSDAEFIKQRYQDLARAYADGILKTLDMMFGN